METQLEILVICCHQQIADTIVRLINEGGEMNGTTCSSAEQALAAFDNQPFDLVLIGAGLPPEKELQLEAELKKRNPLILVVYHFGGGSGLLFTEIREALKK